MMVSMLMPVLLVPAGAAPAIEPDPPVQVWFSDNAEFARGDYARVFVRTEQDGYLVVLHSDADGRMRVLFPLDPGVDEFVRGGQDIEIRGRAGREAFLVDERDGTGTVLAAWSPDPFRFDAIALGDHWDYRVLVSSRDAEADLLDVADRVSGGQRYYYDVAQYLVGRPARSYASSYVSIGYSRPYCLYSCFGISYSSWSPGFSFAISIGSPWSWYDPWYYNPYYSYRWRARYYGPFWGPFYRPIYAWNPYPYYSYRAPRYRYVSIRRYADGCWNYPNCGWNPPRGRSGRATGVGLAQRTAFGLTEPVRSSPGIGMSRLARQHEVASQPRRLADGLDSNRMRSAAVSTEAGGGGIGRSAGARSRIATARDQNETGRFESRPDNNLSRAARARDSGNGAASERASTDPSRQTGRIGSQASASQRSERAGSNGVRASDGGGRVANPRSESRGSGRSWILSPPERSTGNSKTMEIGSSGNRSAVRSPEARPATETQSRQRIRSSAGSENRSTSGVERGAVSRSSGESSMTERLRSNAVPQTRSTPPAHQSPSRSSGISSSIPRSSSGSASRGREAIRTSEPTRSSGVTRSAPTRSSAPSRSATNRPATTSRSSGSTSRASGSTSRPSGGSSRSIGSASRSSGSSSQARTSGSSRSGSSSSRGIGSAARRKN